MLTISCSKEKRGILSKETGNAQNSVWNILQNQEVKSYLMSCIKEKKGILVTETGNAQNSIRIILQNQDVRS